jgi:hydrogenase 3 maturation protease
MLHKHTGNEHLPTPAEPVDVEQLPEKQLKEFLQGQVCLFGIGNRHWRDDGVGSFLAEEIEGHAGVNVVDAGCVPENHLERVAATHPDTILMLDATDFGGKPGQVRLLYPDKVAWSGLSTHAGSLQMLARYLHARTQANIALLAIQPAVMASGEGLSPDVARTVRLLQQRLPVLAGASLAAGG